MYSLLFRLGLFLPYYIYFPKGLLKGLGTCLAIKQIFIVPTLLRGNDDQYNIAHCTALLLEDERLNQRNATRTCRVRAPENLRSSEF